MLSSAAVVAVIGTAAAFSGHHMADVPALLVLAAGMAAASIPLSFLLFRPLAQLLAGAEATQRRLAALQRLPVLSALCIFALAAIAIGSYVGRAHGSWRALAAGEPRLLAAMAAHVFIFSAYLGLFAYFMVLEHCMKLRAALWSRRPVAASATRGRLAVRMALGFAAVAAAPLLVLLNDTADDIEGAHPAMRQAAQMDLFAAALLAVVLVVLLVRTLSRQVKIIIGAMDRVDDGDLEVQAPVVTDDELGALAERFNTMVRALRERERMRRTFSRFVPEAVAGALIADEGAIAPQEREATVLYADIEGFTTIAARLQPREILDLLNAHFEEVGRIIDAHGGVVTQFQGDAVLAGFNLPAALPDHAARAVAAALEICSTLERRDPPTGLRMRVGISTGHVIGGTVGGGERIGYTLHGDTVNLAARLEELNKSFGSRILIAQRTAELLPSGAPLRNRGTVPVRGFAEPLRLYEPLLK